MKTPLLRFQHFDTYERWLGALLLVGLTFFGAITSFLILLPESDTLTRLVARGLSLMGVPYVSIKGKGLDVLAVFLLISIIVGWFFYLRQQKKLKNDVAVVLAAAWIVAMATAMALLSEIDRHPDEALHLFAADYYVQHWIPLRADKKGIKSQLHAQYGVSYLLATPPNAFYFIAGKLFAIGKGFGLSDLKFVRLMNVTLFTILCVSIIRRKQISLFLFLFMTPQLWYVFSYFSDDAFGLFLGFMLVFMAGDPRSGWNHFLRSDDWRMHIGSALLFALFITGILLGKRNMLAIIVYLSVFSGLQIMEIPSALRMRVFARWCSIGALGLSMAAPIALYDAANHGFNKSNMLRDLREKYAADGFRPSQAGTDKVQKGMWLKKQGVSLKEVALGKNWHWFKGTSDTFLGYYGYLSVTANGLFYKQFKLIIFLGTMAVLAFMVCYRYKVFQFSALGVFVVALLLCASLYHSWTYDYQTQGRYILPLIPGLVLVWQLYLPESLQRLLFYILSPFLLLYGLVSFVYVGLAGLA